MKEETREEQNAEVEPDETEQVNRCYTKLTGLVDRLQVCSEIKYPDRKWNLNFYNQVKFNWKNKIDQLEERVNKLENEIKIRVCDKCYHSSCWQGMFLCDESRNAGTVDLTIKELKEKDTQEHWSYWIETYVDERT